MAMNMDASLRLSAKVDGLNNIVSLNRGLQSVESTAKGVTGAMRGLTGAAAGLSGALGALAPLLSVAGLAGMVQNTIKAGDSMYDLSQRTGVTVESLAKFKKAAATSGTDIEGVSKSLTKLSKTMLEANAGSSTASKTFKALGVDITGSNGQLKSADAVMLEVANRFKAMPDGVAKTALALRLFGKSGAEMIPMLNMGGDAIDRLSVKMTTAFAQKMDQYSDRLATLGGKVGALGMDLTVALLPVLEALTDVVTKAITAFNGLSQPVKNLALAGASLALAWGPAVALMRGAIAIFATLTTAQAAAGAAAAASAPQFAASSASMSAAAVAASRLALALSRLAAIGVVTAGVNYIINVASDAAQIRSMRDRQNRGGAAGAFAGATRETVVQAQAGQAAELRRIQQQRQAAINDVRGKQWLYQIPVIGAYMAQGTASQMEKLNLREQFTRGVLGLNPNNFRAGGAGGGAGFSPDLGALESGGGGGGKAKKERDSQLLTIEAANGLFRSQEAIKARIAEAEQSQNTSEKLRLEMIDRGVRLMAEAADIQREKLTKTEREVKLKGIDDKLRASEAQYTREIAIFQKQAVDSLPSYLSGLESAASGYSRGLELSKQLTAEQEKQKQLADGIANSIGQGMASAFDGLIAGTEEFGASLRKIASGVLMDIAKQLLQIYVINTAINAISGLFGPKTGGFLPGIKFNPAAFSMPALAANGMVAANGIQPFAKGGLVDRPTLFRFASGGAGNLGLMGEAGPEAIMPLKRGRDGKLGIAGGGSQTNVTVNVDAKGTTTQGDAGKGNELARVVAQAVQAELVKQRRPGGILAA